MVLDQKIKKTEGRKGQNGLWAQQTKENMLKKKSDVLVHSLNIQVAFADVWIA